jgi:hypothetical protein
MFIGAHTIAAGAVGERIGDPLLAFLVGVVVHLVLDMIPHYETVKRDPRTGETVWPVPSQLILFFGELLIGIYIIFYILRVGTSGHEAFWAGAFGGILPDLIDSNPLWSKRLRKRSFFKRFHRIHEGIHIIKDPQPFWGLLTQVLVILFFTLWYLGKI